MCYVWALVSDKSTIKLLLLFYAQYFVDVIREQQLIEWGQESANGGPFDDSKMQQSCNTWHAYKCMIVESIMHSESQCM